MMQGYNTTKDLPAEIPIFPLGGAIVMPGVSLPLNIFEPRYLAMVDHAMKTDKMVGMIQPKAGGGLYNTGCAGRIVAYSETDDGRYHITLRGICRFDVAKEHAQDKGGFRLVQPSFGLYAADLLQDEGDNVCREAMLDTLKSYLVKNDMSCDQWQAMETVSCSKLVATLCVICPFSVEEKQMLLEAQDLPSRMKVLKAFLELDVADCGDKEKEGGGSCH